MVTVMCFYRHYASELATPFLAVFSLDLGWFNFVSSDETESLTAREKRYKVGIYLIPSSFSGSCRLFCVRPHLNPEFEWSPRYC